MTEKTSRPISIAGLGLLLFFLFCLPAKNELSAGEKTSAPGATADGKSAPQTPDPPDTTSDSISGPTSNSSSPIADPLQSSATRLKFGGSLQVGAEWDDNIFKTFGNTVDDALLRILLKLELKKAFTQNDRLNFQSYTGGKKFFRYWVKDMILQQFDLYYMHRFDPRMRLSFDGRFKLQNENEARDPLGLNINEDYILGLITSDFLWAFAKSWSTEADALFEGFNFGQDRPYDYLRYAFRFEMRKRLSPELSSGIHYAISQQFFTQQNRDDVRNAAGIDFKFFSKLVVQFGYTFLYNASSGGDLYSFSNHRLNLLITAPITLGTYTVFVNLMGVLQLKNFPDVYRFDEEGARFLLTGAEAESFNSLVVKLSGAIVGNLSWEFKWSNYFNDLTSAENDFGRILVNLGLRIDF